MNHDEGATCLAHQVCNGRRSSYVMLEAERVKIDCGEIKIQKYGNNVL
jgi:hypothetical protein